MRKMKQRHPTTALALCCCLLCLLSCTPVLIPHRDSADTLPIYPEAWRLEPVPDEVIAFMTAVKQRVGSACPGVWRSYVANATAEAALGWYQRTMRARGWTAALDDVPFAHLEPESLTWAVWTHGAEEDRSITALFLDPAGVAIAPPETPAPDATPQPYTYILVLTCPIYELASRPYAR